MTTSRRNLAETIMTVLLDIKQCQRAYGKPGSCVITTLLAEEQYLWKTQHFENLDELPCRLTPIVARAKVQENFGYGFIIVDTVEGVLTAVATVIVAEGTFMVRVPVHQFNKTGFKQPEMRKIQESF